VAYVQTLDEARALLGAAHATGGSLVVLTGAAGRRREPDYNI
jgi:hypothetical protein